MNLCFMLVSIPVLLLLYYCAKATYLLSNDSIRSDNVIKKKQGKLHVPKFMLELYERNKSYKRNNFSAPDVVRSLIPTHAGLLENNEVIEEYSDKHLLTFDLPNKEDDEVFVEAELKIMTVIDSNTYIKRNIQLSIFDSFTNKFLPAFDKEINHVNNTWLSFDVTVPVYKILNSNKNKDLKVMVTVKTFYPHLKRGFKLSLLPSNPDFDHQYPVLMLSYASKKKNVTKRKKRSIEEDYEEETNIIWDDAGSKKRRTRRRNTCRRKPLYIDFSEIEYDLWILQPSGYEAYQCQGRCFYPVAEHLNPTKHAIVQALLHSVSPSRASRSCCVPTALDSISILYVDDNGVLTYRFAYQDMVVKECGCR